MTRTAKAESVEALPGPRVANPRPISTEPPDPRDTTREIEKSATRQRDLPGARAPADRRAVELAALGVVAESPRQPIETRTVVGGGLAPSVAPVKPIAAASEPSQRGALSPQSAAPIKLTRTEPVMPGASDAARVEPAGASAPTSGAAGRDIIEGRISATRDWLAAAPQTTHTIQIMGSSNEQQLKNQLKSLAGVLDPNRIFVYRTVAQGKSAITVVYGAFADRESAARALAKLPPSVAANRPVLRTVNGIRTEMKEHGKF